MVLLPGPTCSPFVFKKFFVGPSNKRRSMVFASKMQIPLCQIKRNAAKKGKNQVWLSLNIFCLVMVTPFVDSVSLIVMIEGHYLP